jgi:5-methylcytosine-specific restriction endonuclease McrA
MKDMTGHVFSKLTVIGLKEKNKRGLAIWNCICQCGKQTVVSGANLRSGEVKSCGCLRGERNTEISLIDIHGKKFGRLMVLERSFSPENRDSRTAMWMCLCDCGNTKALSGARLRSGRIISCGCANKDKPGLMSKQERSAGALRALNRRARQASAGGQFSKEDISAAMKRQRCRCVWCKTSIKEAFHCDHRIPLDLGGSNNASNIDLLCPTCNMRKGRKPPEQWARQWGYLI